MSEMLINPYVFAAPSALDILATATWRIDADVHDGNSSVENLGTGGAITGTESGVTFYTLDGAPGFHIKSATSWIKTAGDIDVDSFDFMVRVRLADWTPSAVIPLLGKLKETGSAGDSDRAFYFRVNTDGTLGVLFRTAGTLHNHASTAATGFTDGTRHWVRVTRDRTSGDVKFWTATDGAGEPGSWTQLGTTVSASTAAIVNNAQHTFIGSVDGTTTHAIGARFYDVIIKNAATAGTIIARMNASDAPEQASWTDGVTWLQTDTGQRAILVDRNLWSFDGTDDYIEWADNAALDLSSGQDCTWFMAVRPYSGAATRVALSKINATPTGFNLQWSNIGTSQFNFAPGASDIGSGPSVAGLTGTALLAGTVDLAGSDETHTYFDGTLGAANAVSDASIANTAVMRMGCTSSGASFAVMDVVAAGRIDRVLSETELDLLNTYFKTR